MLSIQAMKGMCFLSQNTTAMLYFENSVINGTDILTE